MSLSAPTLDLNHHCGSLCSIRFRPFVCVFVLFCVRLPSLHLLTMCICALCLSRRLLARFVCLAVRLFVSLRLVCCRRSVCLCVCFVVLLWGWFAVVFLCGLLSIFLLSPPTAGRSPFQGGKSCLHPSFMYVLVPLSLLLYCLLEWEVGVCVYECCVVLGFVFACCLFMLLICMP